MNSISILGCGWLGLPLGKHLAQIGYQVKGSTTQKEKLKKIEQFKIRPYNLILNPEIEGDASDFFDSDILLVNLPPRNRNGVKHFHENQLKSVIEHSKSKHVVFISSTAVYPSNNETVTEGDAHIDCVSRGGVPLYKMEKLFTENTNFKTTVIRFGGLYGPDRHPGNFLAGKENLSGAENPINMIHQTDCIGIIESIIEKGLWGETFNASAPSDETRQSFYEKASIHLNVTAPTFSNEPAPFKIVSSEKLQRMTGYVFKY